LPPEVEQIAKRLMKLLESDEEQNNTVPEPYCSSIAGGLSCDELSGALGEFGRTPYIDRQRCLYHFAVERENLVDIYAPANPSSARTRWNITGLPAVVRSLER
jgi:hypothetical protein